MGLRNLSDTNICFQFWLCKVNRPFLCLFCFILLSSTSWGPCKPSLQIFKYLCVGSVGSPRVWFLYAWSVWVRGSVCLVRLLSQGACRTSWVWEVSSLWKLPACWELCSLCSGGQCDRAVWCAVLRLCPGMADAWRWWCGLTSLQVLAPSCLSLSWRPRLLGQEV